MQAGNLILAGTELFTPWFGRQADHAIFTYEEIWLSGAAVLGVDLYTKNSEETGAGTLVTPDTGWPKNTGSIWKLQYTAGALEELLRFKVGVQGNPITGQLLTPVPSCDPGASIDVSQLSLSYAIYRFLAPTWFDKA